MTMSRKSALRFTAAGLLIGAGLALSGCESTGRPVQVTRFHLAAPIAPGSFSVESTPMAGPGSPMAPDSLELAAYSDIVANELSHYGFTRAPAATSELAVSASVDRASRPDYSPGSSLSFGFGGASFGRHTGVGGGVGTTVPLGSKERFIVGTRMMIQIKRRSDGTVIWEGRGMTEAKGQSPEASPQAAVTKLVHALFLGFPGESGRTITVK